MAYLNNSGGAFTNALADARTSMINSGAIARLGGISVPQGVRHPDHVDRLPKMIEVFDRNLANKP